MSVSSSGEVLTIDDALRDAVKDEIGELILARNPMLNELRKDVDYHRSSGASNDKGPHVILNITRNDAYLLASRVCEPVDQVTGPIMYLPVYSLVAEPDGKRRASLRIYNDKIDQASFRDYRDPNKNPQDNTPMAVEAVLAALRETCRNLLAA